MLTFSVVGVNVVIVPLGEKPQVQKENKKEKQVKGRVTDKEGLPIPGVSVLIDSTTIGCGNGYRGKLRVDLSGNE